MIHTHSITQKDVFLPSAAKKTSNSLAIRFQGTLVVLGWTMVGIPMLIAIAGGQG